MRNLKTFENWKGDYLNTITDIIDDCMAPLMVYKFKKKNLDLGNRNNFKFIANYQRNQTSNGLIQVNGYIKDGKVIHINLNPDNRYSPQYKDFVNNEFMSVMEQIAGMVNDQLNFSYTNYHEKEEILIFIPKEDNRKKWM